MAIHYDTAVGRATEPTLHEAQGLFFMAEKQTGVAISFMVPGSTASALALPLKGALPASELHLTLAYIGDTAEQEIDRDALVNHLQTFVTTQNALRISINGAGFFQNDPKPIWLAVESPELPAFRQALIQHLDDGGFHYNNEHGFTPHITLAYIGGDQPLPNFELKKLNFIVGDLTLMYEGEHVHLPLSKKEKRMTFVNLIKRLIGGDTQQRALSVDLAWEQIWTLIYERSLTDNAEAVWPIDIYIDNQAMFVIGARQGRLARAPMTVNGDSIYLGNWENVEVDFVPRTRQNVIKREGERAHIVQVVSTSTLNRDAEIDSRELFDNFVARCRETEQWPLIDFWHQNDIVLGQVIPGGVFRDENCYVNIWQFRDDEIGRAAEGNYLANPDYWGASIEFIPLKRSLTEVTDGVRIPVYQDGIHTYTTILPEQRAAAWFTGKKARNNEMNDQQYNDLVKLLGEDLANAAANVVDETNGEIRATGMITRGSDAAQDADEETPETPATPEIVLDDDVTSYLVDVVTQSAQIQEMVAVVGRLTAALDSVTASLAQSETAVAQMRERLAVVERSDEEKLRGELNKLPAGTVRVRVGNKTQAHDGQLDAAAAAMDVVSGWNFRNNQ